MPFASQSPYQQYLTDLSSSARLKDEDQLVVLLQLQALYEALCAPKKSSRWQKLFGITPSATVTKGIYIWGSVGRGKTYLMDLFFNSLPFAEKQRLHFHRFMGQTHQALRDYQGQKNPLQKIAQQWAKKIRVLCFDEFYVSDIADAMILAELLTELFAQGVILVATSNVEPKHLYKEGLQRERFLPAIDLLYRHTQVMEIGGSTDFRLRTLTRAQLYYSPLSAAVEQSLCDSFAELSQLQCQGASVIEVLGREISVRQVSDEVLWCDFSQLCDGPRSQQDYIELSRCYHTVIISNIPVLTAAKEDAARRFIALVDEFYDRSVKLILSSAADISALYQGDRLKFEFQRTQSRLLEMQSYDYLAKPHQS